MDQETELRVMFGEFFFFFSFFFFPVLNLTLFFFCFSFFCFVFSLCFAEQRLHEAEERLAELLGEKRVWEEQRRACEALRAQLAAATDDAAKVRHKPKREREREKKKF